MRGARAANKARVPLRSLQDGRRSARAGGAAARRRGWAIRAVAKLSTVMSCGSGQDFRRDDGAPSAGRCPRSCEEDCTSTEPSRLMVMRVGLGGRGRPAPGMQGHADAGFDDAVAAAWRVPAAGPSRTACGSVRSPSVDGVASAGERRRIVLHRGVSSAAGSAVATRRD